jgi:hypothetical protein
MHLRVVTLATVIFSFGVAAWIYFSSPSVSHVPLISPALILELLDQRNAATLLPREAYSEKFSLPLSAIDLTIDRKILLRTLFLRIAAGQPTDQARVEAWVRYVQDRIAHPKWAPLLENGQAIYDPYWILKNRIGQCGQTNRVVIDGLNAAGFKTRLVQLKSHVAAEVWLDGGWRFLDADWLDLGQFVRHRDGTIASADEIYRNPELLEGLSPGMEFKLYPIDVLHPGFEPYELMFSVKPYYVYKTADIEQERNEYFGWNYYETIRE